MQVICAGRGRELPAGRGRGRPVRFHDATCRKRAHRARQASRHAQLLGEVETAVSELGRVVLAGEPSPRAQAVATRLARAADELVRRLDDTTTSTAVLASTPTSVEDAAAAVDQPVFDQPATHQVTKTAANQGPGRARSRSASAPRQCRHSRDPRRGCAETCSYTRSETGWFGLGGAPAGGPTRAAGSAHGAAGADRDRGGRERRVARPGR